MIEGLIFLSSIVAVGLVIVNVIAARRREEADAKANAGRGLTLQNPSVKKADAGRAAFR
jgi:hypothetical protein